MDGVSAPGGGTTGTSGREPATGAEDSATATGAEPKAAPTGSGPAGAGATWVVVGPYPPSADPGAGAALEAARQRLRAGHRVRVISPVPTAAAEHAHLLGRPGLHTIHRACQGAAGLWLRLQPGIGPTPGASRLEALAERARLARVLRSVPESVVDVGDVRLLPGGRAGRLVLDAASRFVVDDQATRDVLVANGADPGKVQVRDGQPGGWLRIDGDGARPLAPPVGADADDDRAPVPALELPPSLDRRSLEDVIGARAAALPVAAHEDPAGALRAVGVLALPAPPPGPKGVVAKVVFRLTAWLLRPIVDHVNRLHAATIDAVERTTERSAQR